MPGVFGQEEEPPVVKLRPLELLIELLLGRIFGVELFQVVRRCVSSHTLTPAQRMAAANGSSTGEHLGEYRVRVRKGEPDGVGVHLLDLPRLAINSHKERGGGDQILVLVHILVPEDKIVGGKGATIAPLHPPTQKDGGGPAAVTELPAPGDIR